MAQMSPRSAIYPHGGRGEWVAKFPLMLRQSQCLGTLKSREAFVSWADGHVLV